MDGDLYRKLIEESSDIATVIDKEGVIKYVSPSVSRTLGWEPEELIGETGFEYQHPDDRDGVAAAIDEIQANPNERRVIETRFRRADGSWCWIESTLQNRTDDEDIGGILVNSREIAERKEKEKKVRSVAQEYKTLLQTVEDSIFFLTVEQANSGYTFRFKRLNRAYEEQTGFTTKQVRGKTPTDVFGTELGAELESNYHRCVAAREPISYQEEVPVETGARFWQTNLVPVVTGGSVSQVIGITRNVTERVEREQRLRRQKEQLDEFASVVSHDLRNPLNVAQARSALLEEECDSDHLKEVVWGLDRMEEIVSDTLTLARQGMSVAETERVDLIDLVGRCWKSVSTEEATIDVEDNIEINGDPGRLQHVFENLFRNAIEHGREDVHMTVGQLEEGGFYVEDDGSGIPAEDREEVFEPGHTSAEDGTGFGLAIVRRIVEAHGWTIEIVEGHDGGARFEIVGADIEPQ